MSDEPVECVICLDDILKDNTETPCNHQYHDRCIKQWLTNHTTCPTCRTVIKLLPPPQPLGKLYLIIGERFVGKTKLAMSIARKLDKETIDNPSIEKLEEIWETRHDINYRRDNVRGITLIFDDQTKILKNRVLGLLCRNGRHMGVNIIIIVDTYYSRYIICPEFRMLSDYIYLFKMERTRKCLKGIYQKLLPSSSYSRGSVGNILNNLPEYSALCYCFNGVDEVAPRVVLNTDPMI